jgi:hypothetical protein
MARFESSIFIAVLKLLFLHVDVKERTRFFSMKPQFPLFSSYGKNGGPDRTRTYDPRLIKAVL